MRSESLSSWVDRRLAHIPASTVAVAAVGCTVASLYLWTHCVRDGDLFGRGKAAVNQCLRSLLRQYIGKQIDENVRSIKLPSLPEDDLRNLDALPNHGWPLSDVVDECKRRSAMLDHQMSVDRLSGVVYGDTGCDKTVALTAVVSSQLWSNPLFADYFGCAKTMESELSRMVLGMFHAPPGAAATYAFGGTESILLAMLSYRNRFRSSHPDVVRPTLVVPCSVHPAFDKAAHYFGIRLVKVPVNPRTLRADIGAMRKSITHDTMAIVGSAPCYPWGVIDPIGELAAMALEFGIGLHVDACVGGFFLPFLAEAGIGAVDFDFSVEGVTTISCDIHKWGTAPKGASMVAFRSKQLRAFATFACSDFPGGLYVTAGVCGSKPGYAIAAAWASVVSTGRDGYAATTRAVHGTVQEIAAGIRALEPHLRLMAIPDVSIIAFTSDTVDIYEVMTALKEKGWCLSSLQFPPGVHLGVTLEHTKPGVARTFLADLKAAVQWLAENGTSKPSAAAHMYGGTQKVHDRTIVADVLKGYVDRYYSAH